MLFRWLPAAAAAGAPGPAPVEASGLVNVPNY